MNELTPKEAHYWIVKVHRLDWAEFIKTYGYLISYSKQQIAEFKVGIDYMKHIKIR